MRKFFHEFFYVSRHGNVRDKVILTRLATTVTVFILCLSAMSITAYAYFSTNVSSGTNVIRTANFEIAVQISDTDGNVDDSVNVITSDRKIFTLEGLTVGKTYIVNVTTNEHSTAKTGFILVTADRCPDIYHTQQLGKVAGGETTQLSFKLMITDTANVYLKAHWGTSSRYDAYKDENHRIPHAEMCKMVVNGIDKQNVETTSTTVTTTTVPVTGNTTTTTQASQATVVSSVTDKTTSPETTVSVTTVTDLSATTNSTQTTSHETTATTTTACETSVSAEQTIHTAIPTSTTETQPTSGKLTATEDTK